MAMVKWLSRDLGDAYQFYQYPLVNVYITNWKITMFDR
jgi:hypothetical protein